MAPLLIPTSHAGTHAPLHGEKLPKQEANAEARRHDSPDNNFPAAIFGAAGLIKPELILPWTFQLYISLFFLSYISLNLVSITLK